MRIRIIFGFPVHILYLLKEVYITIRDVVHCNCCISFLISSSFFRERWRLSFVIVLFNTPFVQLKLDTYTYERNYACAVTIKCFVARFFVTATAIFNLAFRRNLSMCIVVWLINLAHSLFQVFPWNTRRVFSTTFSNKTIITWQLKQLSIQVK